MALSGSFSQYIYGTSAQSSHPYQMTVEWSGVQNYSANTTTITASLYIDSTPIASWNGSETCSLAVNGITKEFESPSTLVKDSRWLIGTETFVVEHDSSGQAQDIPIFAAFHFNGYFGVARINATYDVEEMVDLDDIQGATVVLSANMLYPDDTSSNVELTVKRSWQGTISHTVTIGGVTQSVTIPYGVSTLTVTLNNAQRTSIISNMTGMSGYYSVTLTSVYDGLTVPSISMHPCQITSENSKPTVTITSVEDTNATSSALGVFIQGVSILKANFNAVYKYGATFSSSRGLVCNEYATTRTASYVSWANGNSTSIQGSQILTVSVTDSRNLTTDVQQSVNILPYSKPTYSSYTIKRRNSVEADVNINISGIFNQVLVSNVAKNTMQSATLQYREVGQAIWVDGASLTITSSGNAWSVVSSGYGDFNVNKSYEIKVTVTDKFNSSVLELILPQGRPTFAIRNNKVGVNENDPQYAIDCRGTARTDGIILKSSTVDSNKYFYIQVDDSGQITATRAPRLPSAYQEVEWIGANGNQWIDTGFIPTNNTKIKIYLKTNSANKFLFGERYAPGANYTFILYNSFNSWYPFFDSPKSVVGSIQLDTFYNIEFSKDGLFVDDSLIQGPYTDVFVASKSIYLFALHEGSGAEARKMDGAIGNVELYENNALVRNMIPCYRILDSEIGMYDIVNGVFYTNAGTGTFTKGNDVN